MIFRDPDMEFVFGEIRDITRQRGGVVMHGFASQNPAHVRPPLAVDGRMRVAFLIGILMMNAMRGHPEDWSAFKRQSCAGGEEILDPLRGPVAAMRQQAMVGHADAQASRNPPKKHGHEQSFPGEEEERDNCPDVKQGHKGCSYPVDLVVVGWLAM